MLKLFGLRWVHSTDITLSEGRVEMLNLLTVLLCISFAAEAPFWKAKPKVYDRVQNGEVIVSVTSGAGSEPSAPKQMRINGGGQVAAPCAFVFESAQKYEEVARLSGYIHDPK